VASRKLEIEIIGDSSSLSRATKAAIADSDTLGSRLKRSAGIGAAALGGGLVAAAGAAAYGIARSTQAAEEANKVGDQTAAVLKSTGHAAKVSQEEVEGLAGAISRKTGVDDEQVQSGANLLLTFTNVRNEAGKGNAIFDQATQTIVDMGAALGQDAKASAIQLGKALNDPIKGITALQRVGVSFSEDKAEQIKQWVEEGEILRAQKAILRELGKEFGGSAEAQATAVDKIKVGVGNVEESIGNVFLPVVEDAGETLNREYIPQLQATADTLAAISSRTDIDLGEKLSLSGDVIANQWGGVPEEIGDLMQRAAPVVAEHAGDLGVAWAKGMLDGFIHADPLGKAAIALLASRAFGGPGALISAGKGAGATFGGAAATEGAAAMAALGMGSRGSKAFGLIDRFKTIGGTLGRFGLYAGVVNGLTEAITSGEGEDRLQNFFHGFTLGLLPESVGVGNELADQMMVQWDDQAPQVARHIQQGLLSELARDRQRLATTIDIAVETGASEERIDAMREKLQGLDQAIEGIEDSRANFQRGVRGLESGKFTRLQDIKTVMQRDMRELEIAAAEGSQRARDQMAVNYRAGAKAIETSMDRGIVKTKTGMAEIQRFTRQAKLVSGDDPWGIAKGFTRSWERSGTITQQSLDRIERDMGKMPPAAAQITGQMMLEMARQMRSKGQLSKSEVERLRSAVVTKLDAMARQGGKKGDVFAANLGGSFGVLDSTVAAALENMGANVGTILEKLGANNPLMNFTLQYGKDRGNSGKGKKYLPEVAPLPANAAGGVVRPGRGPVTVPGQGLLDTVPLLVNGSLSAVVAPDEVLVAYNRHQLPMADEAFAARWGVNGIAGFFDTYDRPHYAAQGGPIEPRIAGPDPLRGGAQAGIHMAFKAGQRLIDRHRPRVGAGDAGVPGYVGPPPSFRQLGDNSWVDSHTLAVANFLASKFRSTITDGWRPQDASYGAVNSSHKRGTPANPGAVDLAPPSTALQAWAGAHIAGLTENDIHDWGTGLHNHIAFFHKGGLLPAFSSGGVVDTMAQVLFNHGFDKEAVAGIIGNAYQESRWNPGAMEPGTHNGGLFGFTTDPVSLQALKDYAAQKGVPWTNAKLQTQFMLHHGEPKGLDLKAMLNSADTVAETTEIFMNEWERPGIPALDSRIEGANKAYTMIGDLEAGAGRSAGPASKQQKRNLNALQAKATNLLQDIKGLRHQYKKYGGTKTGRRSLNRALRFAEDAAEEAAAGNRDNAKKLISEAREEIDKARDSFVKAQENVYTPGLLPGKMPGLATSTYDPAQDFSDTNLPGFDALPPEVQALLKSPGLNWAGRFSVLETASSMAELTESRADDAAALNAMLGMNQTKRKHLKDLLRGVNDRLSKGGLTKAQRQKLIEKRDNVLAGLGEVAGNIASIRGQIGGLNDEDELADTEDPAVKAAEEAKQAAEEMKAAAEALKEELEKTRQIAESETAVGLVEARRLLADMLSHEVGARSSTAMQAAGGGGIGTLGRR
jgi:hypothetical protein